MDLIQLRYLLAIAQAGSLSAAAKRVGVTQPTLTVAMRKLEEELGSTLLVRDHRGVTLTSTGEALRAHAEQAVTLLEQATTQIRDLERSFEGSFILGCHESLGAYFLPGFLSSFLSAEPRIHLALWNGSSAAVQQAVIERRIHFGLVVNPRPQPDLVIMPLFHDAVDLFIAKQHGTALGGAISGHSFDTARRRLLSEPLVFAGRIAQSQELIDRLAALQIRPSRLLSCGDLELVKSLALHGVGTALLPRRVAGYGQPLALQRLHPDLPCFPDSICLLFRGDLHRTRGALRVKEELVVHGKRLHEQGDGYDPPSGTPPHL